MRYIKKVILKNFQSHKHTELEFDKHLNVIVGPSDHGKSAIIRGIQWALFNEPAGDFFIREGEKECSVTLIFSDNTKVTRYRSKSKNIYIYYNRDGEKTIYEGFGNNVPGEIKENINIRKVYLDTKETNSINISEQLEGPFLLSERKSVRANAIGRLVGVHIVDDAIRDTVREIINLNSSKKNLIELQNNLTQNLKEYDYLDDLEKIIDKLDKLSLNISRKKEKVEKFKKLKFHLDIITTEIESIEKIVLKLKDVEYIEKMQSKLDYVIKMYTFIKKKQTNLMKLKKNIEYNKRLINRLGNVKKIENIFVLLYEKKEVFTKMLVVNDRYKKINREYNYNKNLLKKLKNVETVEEKINLAENSYYKLDILNRLKQRLDAIQKRKVYGKIYLDKLSTVKDLEIIVIEINQLSDKRKVLLTAREKYISNLKEGKNIQKNIQKEKDVINKLLKEYKNLLSKFEVCPLCFNKIDVDTIDKLVDNYS